VLPDLRTFNGVMGAPLLSGDQGVEQTINLIRPVVDNAVKDPEVNVAAIGMIRGIDDQFSRDQKAHAIYNAVATRWFYVEDPVGPFGPKETVRPVRVLLQNFAGDCDDASTLIASLLGTIGIPSRLVTIAADPTAPDEFSHIYPEAEVVPGNWVAMDVARPGSAYGSAPQRYFRKRVWSLTNRTYQDMSGGRCSSLNGYAVLGDDPAYRVLGDAATDITALATLESGAAQIASAVQGQPTIPFSYASGASPYSSYFTGLTPGAVAPSVGYPSSGQLVATLGGGATPWILGLVALGLVAWGLGGRRGR
jgi:hypothetical protein